MRSHATGSTASFSRRRFLQTAGAIALATRSSWARAAFVPASDRITIGVIGWGMMGPANTKAFLTMNDCQVVAACDLDKAHLQAALDTVNGSYGNQDCKAYHDYREMLARDRHRRHHDCGARPLARDHRDGSGPPEEGHLRREAAGPHRCRAAGHRPRSGEEQRHLADRLLAALAAPLPQSRGDRPQRAHWRRDAC